MPALTISAEPCSGATVVHTEEDLSQACSRPVKVQKPKPVPAAVVAHKNKVENQNIPPAGVRV